MHTLREIVNFTGVTSDAGQRVGEPLRRATMRSAASMVPLLSNSERTSMRAMIVALQHLPSISLTAELVGASSGEVPFAPDIHVQPSGGAVVETVVKFFFGGRELPNPDPFHPLVNGREFAPNGLFSSESFDDPGPYVAVVRRTGITNVGITVLEQRLNFAVTAPAPPPPPPPPPPPHPLPVPVTCQAELAPDQPGGEIKNMRIFGGGFQYPETVEIIEGAQILATTQADQFGMYSVTRGFPEARLPVDHTVHAHGQMSGRISTDAGFTV